MANPTEFLSRTGYRQVQATVNADLSGVITSVGNVTSVGTLTTALIPEVTNLYYTNERVDDEVNALIQDGTGISWVYDDTGNTLTPTVTLAPFNTGDLAEGVNLYFTDERAQDAVGSILFNTATINLTYNDPLPGISADLNNTTVTPGTYTSATFTVDAQGRLTAAASKAQYTSSDQTITSGGALTLAHGLGAIPLDIKIFLVCVTGELGYTAGDILLVNPSVSTVLGTNKGLSIVPDATNLNIRMGSAAASFDVINKGTGASAAITNVNWNLRFIASVAL